MSAEQIKCARCGQDLPMQAADGLCPTCRKATTIFATGGAKLPAKPESTVVLDRERLHSDAAKQAAVLSGNFKSFGDYDLLEGIARGGMGAVYKARQRSLQRTVALKVILSGALAGEEEVKRFRTEVESVAKLDHPNIVPIYEVGQVESQHYFTMRLIDGGGLDDRLEEYRKDLRKAARLMTKVSRAVHYAHQRGILHRDLKPDNILIDDQGEPQITDFGLAKRVEDDEHLTISGAIMGTPAYMAPEQATGKTRQLSTAVDVYSLGAVLYLLLTGRPPFQGETPLETLRQALEQEPASPRVLNPAADVDLTTICLKCLEKDPQKRYGSAEALAEDLERWLRKEPILARPATTTERFVKAIRRHPALAGLIAVSVVAVISFIVMILINEDRLEEERDQARFLESVSKQERVLAEGRAEQARLRLVRLNVGNGLRLFDQGDASAALLWIIEALRLEAGKSAREEVQRVRIAALLNQCPKLHSFWTETEPLQAAAATPDGKRLVTFSADKVRYWNGSTGEPSGEASTHDATIKFVALSPDGMFVVASAGKRSAQVWEIKSGKKIATLRHEGDITHLSFSPDGRFIATCSEDKTAQVWDARTGQPAGPALQHRDVVFFATFGPDSRMIATGSKDRTCQVWDVTSGKALLSTPLRHTGWVNRAAFSPDGTKIVTASQDRTARLWDARTGEMLGAPMHHNGFVTFVEFSPDGTRLVTANADNTARIWSVATTEPLISPVAHSTRVQRAVFSPDGRRLLTVSEKSARVWDATTGQPVTPPLPSHEEVLYGGFGQEGRFVLLLSKDQALRVWDAVAHGAETQPLPNTADLRDAVFNRDGTKFLTVSGRSLRIWNAATGKPVASPMEAPREIIVAGFTPDSRLIVSVNADQTVRFWEVQQGRQLPRFIPLRHDVELAAFSRNGRRLATAGFDRAARIWDLGNNRQLGPAVKHNGRIRFMTFSPDGQKLLTASEDRTARLWDANNGRPLTGPLQHENAVEMAVFSADGKFIVTASADNTAQVWDAQTGLAVSPPIEHDAEVVHAEFSPDGRHVVTASADNTARVWDATTGEPVTPVLQHNGWVEHAVFSPDGTRAATASWDNSARIWDALTGEPLTPPLPHKGRVHFVLFSPDGRRLITGSPDGPAQLWSLSPDARPLADLTQLANLLSGRRIDATGSLAPLKLPALADAWQSLRKQYPDEFSTKPEELLAWHAREADAAEEFKDWYAAVFHLERLASLQPKNGDLRKRRDNAHAEWKAQQTPVTP
ncbi:MAG: serine/threonine-protein kinase [Verrucomicrobiota bacterium]